LPRGQWAVAHKVLTLVQQPHTRHLGPFWGSRNNIGSPVGCLQDLQIAFSLACSASGRHGAPAATKRPASFANDEAIWSLEGGLMFLFGLTI